MKPRRSLLWLIALTVLADAGLAIPATRYGSAFVLLWILPGLAWASTLARPHRRPPPGENVVESAERIAAGLGLGLGTTSALTLLLHYVPGPLTLFMLLFAINALICLLALLTPRHPAMPDPIHPKPPNSRRIRTSQRWAVIIILLVAAFFRLVHLAYSEFQGDEGIVMVRAARAILGDGEQLFLHQKGPAEVLLPMATWALSGTINEWQARLPFAYAGILGIVSLYLLGRRWFNKRSALIAALLLAINGYFVGFGRIVQYQSIVLATTTLALLALSRWSTDSEAGRHRWLLAGAALLAFGMLAHYDAGMAVPAAAYLVARRLWRQRASAHARTWFWSILGASALALGVLALFYVPFALHPNFAKTLGYLGKARIGTGGPLYNNLLSSLPLATFYNSTYYLAGLAALIIVASFKPFRRLGILIPAACYLFLILCHLPGSVGAHDEAAELLAPLWAGPLLAALITAILLSRRSSAASRSAWLWFGVPFLFYYFLVWDPRTHVLNAFPGAVLLAACGLDELLTFLRAPTTPLGDPRPQQSRPHLAVGVLLLAVFLILAYYPYLMFVQHNPEIKRTWPAHRPTLYWRPGGETAETPLFGYFGFPYRAGWKTIGTLAREGILSGTYASNEENEVAGWYVPTAERSYCPSPEWYLVARNVQDEVAIPRDEIEAGYHLWGEVHVAGETRLSIYRRGPAGAAPQVFNAADYASRFDAHTTPGRAIPPLPTDLTPAGHTLGESVRLLGYRLDTADARPGGELHLVLYWEPLRPLDANYQVFNHLYDETSGTMWGQRDGAPACAMQPTVLWEPGHVVRDEYTIPIDPAIPAGDIPLLVGMYRLDDGERLPVRDPAGVPIGDAIPLEAIPVR